MVPEQGITEIFLKRIVMLCWIFLLEREQVLLKISWRIFVKELSILQKKAVNERNLYIYGEKL